MNRASPVAPVALIALLTSAALGCEAPEPRERQPPPRPPASASAAPAARSAAPPPRGAEVASAAPSAGGSGELAGAWAGRYEAKKGNVTLPPKVKDKGLASDDGHAAVGPGAIELAILANGDIRGKMSGALGVGEITGRLDGGMVRAVVRPEDPFAANAMTGILVGERKGDVLACELHVAGPDGTMIRESTVELARKK